jgi:hypothetical protein
LNSVLEIRLARGELEGARHLFDVYERLAVSTDIQEQGAYKGAFAALAFHDGRYREALEAAEQVFELRSVMGFRSQSVKLGWMYAVDAALRLDNRERAQELVEEVAQLPPGLRAPFLDAHLQLFRARLALPEQADGLIASAEARFRELSLPYWLARALQQRADTCLLIEDGRSAEYAEEARTILARLGARERPVAAPA